MISSIPHKTGHKMTCLRVHRSYMTNQSTPTAPSTNDASTEAFDPRSTFAKAIASAQAAVDKVTPEQLNLPTPCDGYNVEGLLGHLCAVLRRTAAVGRGEPAMSVPQEITGIAADGWAAEFTSATVEVTSVWSDADLLSKLMILPWAQMPGFALLGMYTGEVSVHTWDLAVATGQSPDWDSSVLEAALTAAKIGNPIDGGGRPSQFDTFKLTMPNRGEGMSAPFGEVVPTPADAPLIDQLVAWTGRNPATA
jgi:uncharacterized protein (TIGR03086 family)